MTTPDATPRTDTPKVELQRLADAVKAMQKDFQRGYADVTIQGALLEIRRCVVRLGESCGYSPEELDQIAQRPRRNDTIATY